MQTKTIPNLSFRCQLLISPNSVYCGCKFADIFLLTLSRYGCAYKVCFKCLIVLFTARPSKSNGRLKLMKDTDAMDFVTFGFKNIGVCCVVFFIDHRLIYC